LLSKRPEELVTEISNLLTPTWPISKLKWLAKAKDTHFAIEKRKIDALFQHALILKSDVRHLIA
jgi:hypothetical protein